MPMLTIKRGLLAMAASIAFVASALAATGDVHKVSGERVNVRTGPSNQATIRGQLLQGEELIELAQQGSWLGVRVARTGEEGWVYSDLVRRVSQSTLDRRIPTAGFRQYARDFDMLIETINAHIGTPMVAEINKAPNNTLRVTPTAEWMLNTGRDAKLYAALAVYQMWKSASGGRPANVALVLGGANYITVSETSNGPVLAVEAPNVGALTGAR
ncbi:SH3 domain-containing protein [Vineibacter terrae]|uniref:SH3 domain-containing protein n=1 Tax=Vineibacter terrae TaxID=2586908 RepID=UPI002E304072|nr:SH3 domain-containing protein [Vineibacter terrae]HEX2887910.1 SH3 domain-containing protein [Vineibacter terrae]